VPDDGPAPMGVPTSDALGGPGAND
jgi:hypothetical protein